VGNAILGGLPEAADPHFGTGRIRLLGVDVGAQQFGLERDGTAGTRSPRRCVNSRRRGC